MIFAGRNIGEAQVPSGIPLRKFDLMAVEAPFRWYFDKHGGKFDDGLDVEQIWASQQLHDASPVHGEFQNS
jgi:hypothetical protein